MEKAHKLFHEPGHVSYCGHVGAPCKYMVARLPCGTARARVFFRNVETTIVVADQCMIEDGSAHMRAQLDIVPNKSKPGPAIGVSWAKIGVFLVLIVFIFWGTQASRSLSMYRQYLQRYKGRHSTVPG